MYKVMIVDDEILVRIGLRAMIDWETLGFQIVDEAGNGESAYQKFKVCHPDVILTDIKMPQKDGLWLIEKVKQERPEVEVVILTAYDDFDYARKALKLNASEYLLKAEMEEKEVEQLMRGIRERLDRAKKDSGTEAVAEQADETEKQERLLGLMLSAHKPLSMVKEQFEELNIPWNIYQCCFLQFDFQESLENYAGEQASGILFACRQLILAQFQSRYRCCIMKQFGKSITALLMDSHLVQQVLETDVEGLQKSVRQYFGICFKSANSRISADIRQVRENGNWIFQISERLFYVSPGAHIVQRQEGGEIRPNLEKTGKEAGKIVTEEQIVRLGECLMNTDEEGVARILEELKAVCMMSEEAPLDLKLKLVRLINSETRICHIYVQEKSEELIGLQKKLLQAGDLGRVFQVLQLCMDCIMDGILNATIGNAQQLIEKAKSWVEAHYGERISLEEVARVVGISQYYFSHLFRKSQGIKFSAYLNEVRVRHAKELLRDPKMTVAQVYEQVGFNDQSYFSKTFKRITGMTITEFREQWQ